MMNLKYYLRGLGIGIIVTALIMGITAGKETLSNAEIIERARALGMVEQDEGTLLKDIGVKEQDLTAEAPSAASVERQEVSTLENSEEILDAFPESDMVEPEKTTEPEQIVEPSGQEELADDDGKVEEPTALPGEETEPQQESEEEPQGSHESLTLQIARGDGSYVVCKKLEEAGMVESATEFDQFLYQNGYDKKIRAGSFEIPAGADRETIAKIICGME